MKDQNNESSKQHRPITSDFYEELESSASLNQICEITFRDDQGVEQAIISPVKNLYTEDGVEYVRLEGRIIRLDAITSVNGKIDGTGQIHTEILEKDRMPTNVPYVSPTDGLPPHEGPSSYENTHTTRTEMMQEGNDSNFKGDIGDIGKTGIPSIDNAATRPVSTGTVHQSEVVKDNFLGMQATGTHHHAIIIDTPDQTVQDYPVQKDTDFTHQYTTSTTPYLIGENNYYAFTANPMYNRLYLTVKNNWYDAEETSELGGYISRISPLLSEGCTLLIDLTAVTPDEDGTITSPGIANKSALFDAGLVRVAELVPYECETLVHGPDSFSVNSVRLRYFKDRMQAEHWLTDDPNQVGTPDDMDLN